MNEANETAKFVTFMVCLMFFFGGIILSIFAENDLGIIKAAVMLNISATLFVLWKIYRKE